MGNHISMNTNEILGENVNHQTPEQTLFARNLRHRQTDAEKSLWSRLRNRQLEGTKFRRQEPRGPYVTDFICIEKKLIIEVDGGHHNKKNVSTNDRIREQHLSAQGYQVLRFWNNEVLQNIEGVMEIIRDSIVSVDSSKEAH